MGVAYLDVTAVSGTATPQLSVFLQGSNDNGVSWFDMPSDLSLVDAGSTQAQQTAVANKRNINGDTVVTAANKYSAIYKHLPHSTLRARWAISGSFTAGQGFTFSVILDVK